MLPRQACWQAWARAERPWSRGSAGRRGIELRRTATPAERLSQSRKKQRGCNGAMGSGVKGSRTRYALATRPSGSQRCSWMVVMVPKPPLPSRCAYLPSASPAEPSLPRAARASATYLGSKSIKSARSPGSSTCEGRTKAGNSPGRPASVGCNARELAEADRSAANGSRVADASEKPRRRRPLTSCDDEGSDFASANDGVLHDPGTVRASGRRPFAVALRISR